ncbi:MAG: 1,2-phenylacetyl-CoA epoxidase subunit PaaD [Actinomycetota bacterium]
MGSSEGPSAGIPKGDSTGTSTFDLRAAIAAIPDPEVPVVTIEDLGILREVGVDEQARTVTVLITPTYSGCPAMESIRHHIEHVARRQGYVASVQTRLSPAWTTDWMSAAGRDKLREFGIAPPGDPRSEVVGQPVGLRLMARRVTCPLCGSDDTEEISRFGSTACKALRRCNECREPFDEFKAM